MHAIVTRVDRAVAVIATDRPGIRPDDTVELPAPFPRVDAAWLGRAVDAGGRPVDGGEAPVASPVPGHDVAPPEPGRPVVTGVGAFDALLSVLPGEAWAVLGPSGSGRTSVLRMIAECGEWDAVVSCVLAPRSRERARLLTSSTRQLSVVTAAGAGPAECAAAVALAAHAAADLARTHPSVALLVDGAERLADAALPAPTTAPMSSAPTSTVATFTAWRTGPDAACPDGHEGALVLDGALAARGVHPAIDLAATLRLSPAPDDDGGTHKALRGTATGDGGADTLLAALRQSPDGDAHPAPAPAPGAIVTREALAALAAEAA